MAEEPEPDQCGRLGPSDEDQGESHRPWRRRGRGVCMADLQIDVFVNVRLCSDDTDEGCEIVRVRTLMVVMRP
jgi:hypothetical protein